ncbi:bifunctional 4-hydroxy-2-oxoglutarate aldolase/2-dehydro-3-deoxy-phosphogluconate aldolase [Arthrobacter globiformis]|uniref:2-dehydro-3-deoxy-phosphogluconate aldolase n=1 Tax=Arthrobacter globiformis TaxID=1665 RepID=A0A328HI60_ARTGO|nr:bifunctional 4-hydroxy-2-oxoglutarate aldolase/2-dehydro-3-deoxy-phosphogluconate aldolase [Arthrobacter globiformis]RAM38267.1 keto-deoxy-phosphogluconate aldolase [Arthrobacter globiformis]
MTHTSTATVTGILSEIQIVPVVVLDDPAGANELADALIAGGIACAEITLRTPAGLEALKGLRGRTDLLLGAGTVLNAADVDLAADAGARFIVSPGFGADVVARCRERGVTAIPGVATASELQAAVAAGLRHVKFFPAEQAGGLPMLSALAGPFPEVRFMPSGGLRPDNVNTYLDHPAVFAAGGSWMVPRAAQAAGDYQEIARLCTATRAQLAERIRQAQGAS